MINVDRLTVDYLDCVEGITAPPKFGWIIGSDKNNVIQRSYILQIALDDIFTALVHDSGIVESDNSNYVVALGFKLTSSTKYYARVKVFDKDEESDWSISAAFTSALISNDEWRAVFVSAETDADADNSKGTYVRRDFRVKSEISRAVVYSTARGLYHMYINGLKVGHDEFSPGWTSYKKRLQYQAYDVTELLNLGENVIGAILGAGWYKGVIGFEWYRNHYGRQTAFLCQLVIFYIDGTKETICTDSSWKGADAPVTFSEIYDGETYDARMIPEGWNRAGFNDVGWRMVETMPLDNSILVSQPGCRVRTQERLPVKRIFITPQGDTVLDFGQNMSGWVCFKVKGDSGDVVELNHFEVLDADGNAYYINLLGAKQTIRYILKGGVEESFHPYFTFQGFQYVRIKEYPGEVMPENFEAVVLHSDMRQTGWFECSNPDINQLQHNILWGLKGNFLDIPTDCPQRTERLGWTGDAEIFSSTACFLMDTHTFFCKWLQDLSADQKPDGGVPYMVPDILNFEPSNSNRHFVEEGTFMSPGMHSATAWSDAALIIPWAVYMTYGDISVLERQYNSMKAWIEFMQRYSNGCIWRFSLELGDWLARDGKNEYIGATEHDFICAAYFVYSTSIFVKAAKILGKLHDYKKYQTLLKRIVEDFHNEFFTPNGRLAVHTQTAHILALWFDLVPEAHRKRTTDALVELLDAYDKHLVTGFVGTPFFTFALSHNGHLKEAFDLLLNDDLPSWLYEVKAGATTVWERWDCRKPDGSLCDPNSNSFNHYAYGAIGDWLYRDISGINPDESCPGYKHTVIAPHFGGKLNYVKSSFSSIYGDIAVEWHLSGNKVALDLVIPHNTTATVNLEQAASAPSGAIFTKVDVGYSARIGSGQHHIVFTM